MTNFDNDYFLLAKDILDNGVEELNERTGYKVKTLTGRHFNIDLAEGFPILSLRKIPVKLFVAEMIWYINGQKELDFFQKFSKIWDVFSEEDNTVDSAYGYRWNHYFQRNQLDDLVSHLQKEPSSRHGVVITWDPNTDGLGGVKKKNVPCVPMWVANIVGGKLNFHVIFRSNDVMLGMPHDVAGFALLQNILAQKLSVMPGYLHYSVSHAHIYENHYEHARKLLTRQSSQENFQITLPENTFERAKKLDESVVYEIVEEINSKYTPQPGLGKMQIAL